ncbi:MAG: LacI family DNA-binding transcriptional regulator, partial [Vallitaleaceae bacterium]|nr:LacI family DNA-binding transcriptional regulator [Vallitaleaceae bacterium]
MAKSVKLSDIAKRAGVSSVTVSKALADKQGVSEEKRSEIKKIAEELGYASISQSKPKNNTGNIGILIPCRYVDRSNSFYWAMYQQVVTKLTYAGYYAILELLQYEDEQKLTLPNMAKDRKIDGLIVIGQVDKKYSEYLWNEDSIATVFLDFYDTHTNYDTVISDGFYGMYIMTSH